MVGVVNSAFTPVAPPPGLDAMTPAKVQLKAPRTAAPTPAPAIPFMTKQQQEAMAQGNSGEWFNAVLKMASHLNKDGLEQALDILDHAIKNVKHAKAVEAIIADAGTPQQPGAAMPAVPHLVAVELWRMQVCKDQQQLLNRLLALRGQSLGPLGPLGPLGAMAGAIPPGAMPAGTMPTRQPSRQQPPQPQQAPQRAPPTVAPHVMPQRHMAPPQRPPMQQLVRATEESMPRAPVPAAGIGAAARAPAMQGAAPAANAKAGGRQVQTLSTSLQLLSNEDPERLFIVRRINKLGFKASRKLKQHFSAYGVVVRVLVAHSTVRQHGDPQHYARRRPSSLGFVHMASVEAVRNVLALGEEQEVDGSFIRVQRFERQRTEQALEEEEEAADQVDFGKLETEGWGRQQTASTTATFSSFESQASMFAEQL